MAIAPINVPNFGSFTPDITPTLANLVNSINEGQKRQTLADLGKGLADGTLDYRQAAGQLASTGNLNGVVSLLQLGEAEKKRQAELAAGQQFGQSLSSLYGGAPASGAPAASAGPSNGYGDAIAGIESGGKYDALGPVTRTGDRAYGKYQVMGQNVGPWTQEVLGRALTPQEFVSSPQAQDAVFKAKFGNYVQKYGPEGAARAWFAGEGGMNDPNRKDQLGTSVASYGQRFMANLRDGELPANAQPTQGMLPQAVPQGGQLSPRGVAMMRALGNPNLPAAQREMAKTLLGVELDGMKLTNNQKEYMMYRAEGGADNFTDWLRGNKAAGKTEVNVSMAGEKEYEKQSAKDFAEMNRDMIKGAQSARMKIGTLTRLDQLLSDPSIYTGTGAQQLLTAKKLAKAIGVDVGDVSGPEAIQAIGNQFALELRNPSGGAGMPGAMSDKDREFLQASVPGLGQTPEGNRKIIDYMKRVAQRSIDVERLRQDYVKNNRRLDEGFYRELERYSDANPLFPEADQQTRRTQMAPQDIDASLANARSAIARNPAIRDAVIQRLRENGIDPGGL